MNFTLSTQCDKLNLIKPSNTSYSTRHMRTIVRNEPVSISNSRQKLVTMTMRSTTKPMCCAGVCAGVWRWG